MSWVRPTLVLMDSTCISRLLESLVIMSRMSKISPSLTLDSSKTEFWV